jgi:CelD/BcsL family acetyltransferase involved in cellulose biosynthesis
MRYGFRWRDEFAYYQTGWLPELASLSLGTVLVAEAIRAARADGARVFDFLRGQEPYKYRFGAVDKVDTTLLLPHGPSGLLLRLKFGAKQSRQAPAAPRPAHVPAAAP